MSVEDCLCKIEEALHNYSSWFVDWELLYNDKSYRPEFPKVLLEANEALKELKEKRKVELEKERFKAQQ